MTHEKKRCKYCGKIYYYQASGDGCFEPTNDDTYCPRCKEIINKALDTEVLKDDIIIHAPKEVDKFSDELLEKMEIIKNEYVNEHKGNCFIMSVACSIDYEHIDIFTIDGYKYYIAWNEDINDKHYFQEYEYIAEIKTFIQPYNFIKRNTDTYSIGSCFGRSMRKFFENNKFNDNFKLNPPTGELYFFETFSITDLRNGNKD